MVGSSQGINGISTPILKVGRFILFIHCRRLINYMLFVPSYLYTNTFLIIDKLTIK